MEDIDNHVKEPSKIMEGVKEVKEPPPDKNTILEQEIYENLALKDDEIHADKSAAETEDETSMSATSSASQSLENDQKSESMKSTTDETNEEPTTPKPGNDKMSRELKSLIAAAKESKLDTNIVHKRNSLPDTHQTPVDRRESNEMPTPNTTPVLSASKRNMRSQNPDFAAKHQKFMSKVTGTDIDLPLEKVYESPSLKRKRESVSTSPLEGRTPKKIIRTEPNCDLKDGQDAYCWQCHKDGVHIQCVACPRSFHLKCLKNAMPICENWTCSECMMIMQAENPETKSYARRKLNDQEFKQVLNFALKRMVGTTGSEPFRQPVNTDLLEDYMKYVVFPMDLSVLSDNIEKNLYKSTDAFQADAKWILHNSMIYNSSQSKLTTIAKSIVKVCRIEMAEIETCPECYINANTHKDTWFIEVCSKPHILVWAKLKGFPFWPAKAVNFNDAGMVDVRFFGAHDKAWVPVKDVYLYSEKDPNTINKHQKRDIAVSIKEVNLHIDKLVQRFGEFTAAPLRTPFDPENLQFQLKSLLPKYRPDKLDTGMLRKRAMTPKKPRQRSMKEHFETDLKKRRSISRNGLASRNSRRSVSIDTSIPDEGCGYGTEEEEEPVNTTVDSQTEEDSDESEEEEKDVSLKRVGSGRKTPIPIKVQRVKSVSSVTKPLARRDSDESTKSSKLSEKVNKIELSDTSEVVIGAKKMDSNEEHSPRSKHDKPEKISTEKVVDKLVEKVPLEKTPETKKIEEVHSSSSSNKSTEVTPGSSLDSDYEPDSESEVDSEKLPEVVPEVKKSNVTLVDVQKLMPSEKEPPKKPDEPSKKVLRKSTSTDTIKSNETTTPKVPKPAAPPVDIKEEILDSEDEASPADRQEFFPALNLSPNVTLSVVEKQLLKKAGNKPKDTLTETIEDVVKGAGKKKPPTPPPPVPQKKTELKVYSVAEINQKRASEYKQKARKTFPNKVMIPALPKKIKETRFEGNKDKMVYIPQSTNKVALIPPNMTYTSMANPTKFLLPQNLFTGLSTTTVSTMVSSAPLLAINTTPISTMSTGTTFAIAPRPATNSISLVQSEEERNTSNGLPTLHLRPGGVPNPSREVTEVSPSTTMLTQTPGTLTQILNRSSTVMKDFFQSLLVEAIKDLGEMGVSEAKVKEQQLEIERLKHKLQEETATLKLEISTLKQAHLLDKQRCMQELKQTMDIERQKAIEEIKSKQWCAMCFKESQYRCCWSTSYCSYSCQRNHWAQHQSKCQQGSEQRNNGSNDISENNSNEPLCVNRTRNDSSSLVKPVKNTYAPLGKQSNNKGVNKNTGKPPGGDKISLITSKPGPAGPSVPTLTFVQNSAGGIELVNHGPIAVGGKLIPSSQFSSKIKGYIVSSNAVTTLSPSIAAPALTTIPSKSITLGSGGQTTTSSLVTSSSILRSSEDRKA